MNTGPDLSFTLLYAHAVTCTSTRSQENTTMELSFTKQQYVCEGVWGITAFLYVQTLSCDFKYKLQNFLPFLTTVLFLTPVHKLVHETVFNTAPKINTTNKHAYANYV